MEEPVPAALVALSELAVIGTPASRISSEHLAYANKSFRDLHATNQNFFVAKPEIVRILNDLAEVAKAATRDMAAAGVGILAGCDALIAGFCVHDEIATMVSAGLLDPTALDTLLAQTPPRSSPVNERGRAVKARPAVVKPGPVNAARAARKPDPPA